MNTEELISTYPRLWHMAMDGSWPAIQEHGLLSTSSLLDLYGVAGSDRDAIETKLRPETVAIHAAGLPGARIRDQKPMSDSALTKCLEDGLTPTDWYSILNRRVFFWPSRERLRRLLSARAYRNEPQLVLTLRTASLVNAHKERVLLSPINSGSTIMRPQPRGKGTFLPIDTYPFDEWRKKRSRKEAVAEVTVVGGVTDVQDHVLAVHRVDGASVEELWRSPKSSSEDGP